MKQPTGVRDLETRLGHHFAQPCLLLQALTHRSIAYENRLTSATTVAAAGPETDNEQLEFLGDAVVGFLVAEELCRRYPELHEGSLTRLRAELVNRRHLGQVAQRLNLGAHMLLGRGEERSGGRTNSALLANCVEAVVAALYLDAGIETTRCFVVREIIEPSAAALRQQLLDGSTIGDSKSALQELVQSQKLGQPEYKVRAESGPDHRKRFLVEVFIQNGGNTSKALARGLGNTKKKAEQEAARRAIVKLRRGTPLATAEETSAPS